VGRERTPRWVAYTGVPFARDMRMDVSLRFSSGVVAGSMVVVAPESKMIRGDEAWSESASSPEDLCGKAGLESLLDGGTGVGRTRSPYFVHRECRRCRRNHSRRVGLVAAFAGIVGDEPAVMGARASFPNFTNRTVVAGCLVVVALRRCRHGGERGRAAGEAASDDALNLSHFLKCDRCKTITLFLQERQRRYVVEAGKDALQLLGRIGRQMPWGRRKDGPVESRVILKISGEV
jgi:hypothetical protein